MQQGCSPDYWLIDNLIRFQTHCCYIKWNINTHTHTQWHPPTQRERERALWSPSNLARPLMCVITEREVGRETLSDSEEEAREGNG